MNSENCDCATYEVKGNLLVCKSCGKTMKGSELVANYRATLAKYCTEPPPSLEQRVARIEARLGIY